MMLKHIFILSLCLWIAFSVPAQSEEDPLFTYGISMHGAPKYNEGFHHFDYVNPQAPQGGTLRLGLLGTFDSLNPFTIRGNPAFILTGPSSLNPVFMSLMARSWDEPFSLYGLIAEKVRVPQDRSWVEFQLNPKAAWSDGTPITVDDVIFTWETLRKKGRPSHRNHYNRVAKVEQTASDKVRFTFIPPEKDKPRDREIPLIIGLMPILAKHWWEDKSVQDAGLSVPLGSGPYIIDAAEPGRRIVLRKTPHWWGKDLPALRGHHNPDVIQIDYYRDDAVALEAFKANAYDLRRENDVIRWNTGYQSPALKNGNIILDSLPHARPEWIKGIILNTRRPLFHDRRVREALTYAFDFEWINQAFFNNTYRRTESYFPNSELAAQGKPSAAEIALLKPLASNLPSDLFDTPFRLPVTNGSGPSSQRDNLRHAKSLLAEAGWFMDHGRLRHRDGYYFTFEILLNDPTDEKVVLEFTRSLRRLGIEATVRTVDTAQYQGRLAEFDFDCTVNRWLSSLSPGIEQMTYWGSSFATMPGSFNYPGIQNPAVDVLARSIVTASTREELITQVRALDRALLWGYYVIPFYYSGRDYIAHWSTIKRPPITPPYGAILETWWVDPPPTPLSTHLQ